MRCIPGAHIHRTFRQKVFRFLAPATVALIVVLAVAVPALAIAYGATPPVQVPDNPLPPGCGITDTTSGTNYEGAEVEPYVDVDRSSGLSNVLAVFQQDRWSNGGAHGNLTAVSHDGGSTWHILAPGIPGQVGAVPAFDRCTNGAAVGADFERSSDPWVSFAPNGDAYQVAISFDVTQGGFGGPSAVLVSKSPAEAHGEQWQQPQTLRLDTSPTTLNDKESITADPNTANNVYAVWDRLVSPTVQAANRAFIRSIAFRGPAWFSRTTNAGASWEPARIIFDPGEKNQTIGNQIVVTPQRPTAAAVPGGVLVDGFDLIDTSGGKSVKIASASLSVALIRSFDQGVSWTGPVIVDQMLFAPVTLVLPSGQIQPVRTADSIPEFAVDRSAGFLYAVWQDRRFTGRSQVAFALSRDGGASWSSTIRINDPFSDGLQVFTPQVHVAADGTVGVSYYQFDDAAGTTTLHFVHCHANSQDCTQVSNWNGNGVASVGGPFTMATAPFAEGFFVGDYEGLTEFGSHGFRPFFVMAQPPATAGLTDPFSNVVCPGGSIGSC